MAGKNEIDLKASISGTEQTKRKIKGVGKATRGVGDDLDKTGQSAKRSGGLFEGLTTKFTGFIAGFVGIATIIASAAKAVRLELEHMSKAADSAAKRMTAARDLMFLGDFTKQHPQLHAEIGAMAAKAALPGVEGKVEIAKAWEVLVSKGAQIPAEKRRPILEEALDFRRTTESNLSTIVNLMLQIYKSDKGATAQAISNLVQQTKVEAGATTEAMAIRLPEVLGIGEAAGLDLPMTAAMWATATGRFDPAKATTGMRMMLSRLQGKKLTDEGEAIKQRLGLRPGMPIMQQMEALYNAYQKGQVKLPELQELFGEEAGPLAAVMIPEYPALMQAYQNIRRAYTTPGLDIVGGALQEVFAPGTREYEEEQGRILDARIDQLRFDKDARHEQRLENWRKQRYLEMRNTGYAFWQTKGILSRPFAEEWWGRLTPGADPWDAPAQPITQEPKPEPELQPVNFDASSMLTINYFINALGEPAQMGGPMVPPE